MEWFTGAKTQLNAAITQKMFRPNHQDREIHTIKSSFDLKESFEGLKAEKGDFSSLKLQVSFKPSFVSLKLPLKSPSFQTLLSPP